MGGKASLLLVLGFSLIFMVAGRNFNNMATNTTINVSNYYIDAKTHTLASSGVNIVINKLFLDATVSDQTFNYSLDGGTIAVTLSTINAYQNIRQLLSVGTFSGASSTIRIVLKPSLFSKFAYFSNDEGSNITWANNDTVWGPFHTNDNMLVQNSPVFYGKVTIGGTVTKNPSNSTPQFLGGFQQGVQISIPATGVSTVQTAAASGGHNVTDKPLVYFEFMGTNIRYRYSTSGSGSIWTTVLASTYAPNGVINFSNSEVHISGTVKGSYTIVASGTTGNQGSIYIDNDIVYNTNPQTNPGSTDMLGIVAQDNVWVTDNTNNNTNGIKIQASIYAQEGSFGAEHYDTRPIAGFIDLYGGITQNIRGAVGTLWGGNVNHGFSKRYRYDNRLLVSYPPFYPGCGSFEVVSWFE
jgi:hypothetical protein